MSNSLQSNYNQLSPSRATSHFAVADEQQRSNGGGIHQPRPITKSNKANGHVPPQQTTFAPQQNVQPQRDVWGRSLSQPNTFYADNASVGYPQQPYGFVQQPPPQFGVFPNRQYPPTMHQSFDQPAYSSPTNLSSRVKQGTADGSPRPSKPIRFIRPPLSPPTDQPEFPFPSKSSSDTTDETYLSVSI